MAEEEPAEEGCITRRQVETTTEYVDITDLVVETQRRIFERRIGYYEGQVRRRLIEQEFMMNEDANSQLIPINYGEGRVWYAEPDSPGTMHCPKCDWKFHGKLDEAIQLVREHMKDHE